MKKLIEILENYANTDSRGKAHIILGICINFFIVVVCGLIFMQGFDMTPKTTRDIALGLCLIIPIWWEVRQRKNGFKTKFNAHARGVLQTYCSAIPLQYFIILAMQQ